MFRVYGLGFRSQRAWRHGLFQGALLTNIHTYMYTYMYTTRIDLSDSRIHFTHICNARSPTNTCNVRSPTPSHIHELTDLALQLGCGFLELSDPRLLSFPLPLHGPDSLFVLQEPFSSNFLVRVGRRKRVRENEGARERACVCVCVCVRQRERVCVCVYLSSSFPVCFNRRTNTEPSIVLPRRTSHDVMMIDPCHHRHHRCHM
jgi:hypothetical protein